MKGIDETVKRETAFIAAVVIVLSLLTQSVFLVIGKWDLTVLAGNILSGAAAVVNFLLMGITVQSAVKKEEKDAKSLMRMSQTLRTLMLFAVAAVGALLPSVFNIFTVIIPLFFPRIAIFLRPLFGKKQ